MIITHKLQPMDLTHKQNTIRVDVVQEDKYSRNVEFALTENGVAWQIPDGTTAVVRYKKPDGTGGNYDTLPDGSTAYQISGNVLAVALAPQVCTVPGSVQLSVGLIRGSAEINTFTVNIVVQPNPGATYQSEDYIKLSGAIPNSGWSPNMYLGTDAQGNVVAKEGTSGGGSVNGDVITDAVSFSDVAYLDINTPTEANEIIFYAKVTCSASAKLIFRENGNSNYVSFTQNPNTAHAVVFVMVRLQGIESPSWLVFYPGGIISPPIGRTRISEKFGFGSNISDVTLSGTYQMLWR